jgi:7,8-dihydropterin-6-yl-methyl-4-(beta-D-ribofuranosyl)aminobenzene 5'-phosphate synthase
MCVERARLVNPVLESGPAQEIIEPFLLEPVDRIEVTTLVDNVIDITLVNQGPAKRYPLGAWPKTRADTLEGGTGYDGLQAEHGYSALITIMKDERACRVLFDAGLSPDGLVANMRRLGLSPHDVDLVVFSHGHFDHTTGLNGFIHAVGGSVNMPVVIHPGFWARRRVIFPGQDPVELPPTSRSALQGAGFEIIERPEPSFLLDRSLLVTGEVDRTTAFETGFPGHQAVRNGRWEDDPLILDDQALIANVAGKGLVVLTGCGHAGIINILRYALRVTATSRIYAVIGGFHLGGPRFEQVIPPTIHAMGELAPEVVVPAHCTGWKAQHALAAAVPDAFIQSSVGTRFELAAG